MEQDKLEMTQGEIEKTKRILKRGLVLNKHYRGVNKEVWQLLHKIYGGGPTIVRKELDIYCKDMQNEYKT